MVNLALIGGRIFMGVTCVGYIKDVIKSVKIKILY